MEVTIMKYSFILMILSTCILLFPKIRTSLKNKLLFSNLAQDISIIIAVSALAIPFIVILGISYIFYIILF